MEKKIYIVTSGEYSDYGIDAVFTTKEKAVEYVEQHGTNYNIEEHNLDEEVEKKTQLWCIEFCVEDGKLCEASPTSYDRNKVVDTCFIFDTFDYWENKPYIRFYVDADSMDRAVKIARERFAAVKANEYIWLRLTRPYELDRYGKRIKQRKNQKGYKIVRLSKNGEAKNKFVHILVLESFCKRPDGLNQINHKDENKENNRLDNLEYCNNVYNQNYGSCSVNKSKSTINDKRKSKQVIQFTKDGTFIKEFPSLHEVERTLGFKHGHIRDACNEKLHTAYGYKWKWK